MRPRLIYAHACFVITFLIWKFGGWIEVLTPTLCWLVITFLFWKTSGWIEDIWWLIYEPFLTWNTFHFRGKEEKCHNKTQIIPSRTTSYPIGTCLDRRTRVQITFARHTAFLWRDNLSLVMTLLFFPSKMESIPNKERFVNQPPNIFNSATWLPEKEGND
jgi:hypothetical protein